MFFVGFGTCLHRARLPANNLEEGKRGSQVPYSKDTESTHQQCPRHHKKHMTLGHAYNWYIYPSITCYRWRRTKGKLF